MTKAPERISVFHSRGSRGDWVGTCTDRPVKGGEKYVHDDHALSLVATENEACAKACEDAAYDGAHPADDMAELGCLRSRDKIRARTPDDATAALKARDQRIRNEALREAAEAVYRSDLKHEAYVEILALITEDQSDATS